MKFIKPEAVGHFGSKNTRHSIYSIDFQPKDNRLATGGGGFMMTILLIYSEEYHLFFLFSFFRLSSKGMGYIFLVKFSRRRRKLFAICLSISYGLC